MSCIFKNSWDDSSICCPSAAIPQSFKLDRYLCCWAVTFCFGLFFINFALVLPGASAYSCVLSDVALFFLSLIFVYTMQSMGFFVRLFYQTCFMVSTSFKRFFYNNNLQTIDFVRLNSHWFEINKGFFFIARPDSKNMAQ